MVLRWVPAASQLRPACVSPVATGRNRYAPAAALARPMAFWRSLEDRLVALQKDRPRMARYMAIAWWVSNGFLLVGFVIIILLATGVWEP